AGDAREGGKRLNKSSSGVESKYRFDNLLNMGHVLWNGPQQEMLVAYTETEENPRKYRLVEWSIFAEKLANNRS
ncbi:1173_t:CDS:2, partial [Acaulospora colombiana]